MEIHLIRIYLFKCQIWHGRRFAEVEIFRPLLKKKQSSVCIRAQPSSQAFSART